jgi:hypothetical protein
MDKTLLRPFVFDALRRTPQTHVHAVESEVRQRASSYERGDALFVQEVIWELLTQGVLAPGKNSLNLHLPFIHVTEYGQRCLEEGTILVHDPDGYAARLQAETHEMISPLVLEGAQDALFAFQRGLLRVSVVLLSRAALEVLVELEEGAGGSANRGRNAMQLPDLADSVRRVVAQRKLPSDLMDGFEQRLSELQAVACLAHTEAGAPRAVTTDRETVLGRLLLFPAQCRFAYALLAECRRSQRWPGEEQEARLAPRSS